MEFLSQISTKQHNQQKDEESLQDKLSRLESVLRGIATKSKKIKKEIVAPASSSSTSIAQLGSGDNNNNKKYVKEYDQIISISVPIELVEDKHKRRFSVDIKYTLPKDPIKKIHIKTVKFGTVGEQEFFEHKDLKRRHSKISKMKDCENILYPKYWVEYYLNHKSGNLKTAFGEILECHKLSF